VVEHLPAMLKAPGSIPNTTKIKKSLKINLMTLKARISAHQNTSGE
jgi:hypothetical protein